MQAFPSYFGIFFLVLIILETVLTVGHELHEHKHEIKDILGSLGVGAFYLVTDFFVKGIVFLLLVKLQQYAPFHLSREWWVWVLLFLLLDLSHYGFHYIEHKCRFFWAAHVVHHSSSYYNFSVALRSPVTSTIYRLLIQAPLCLVGFQPSMILIVESFVLIYAFLLHTEYIKKLGWFEIVFNTPSHHRVHHASNDQYLDKNFGAVLIIWDKLFNTFQPEEEKVVYGLTTPLTTSNPVVIFSHEWICIGKNVKGAKNWKDAVAYIFSNPGWKPLQTNKRNKADIISKGPVHKEIIMSC